MRDNNKFSKLMPKEAGFTLVELMVTIAVFAILVALALPNFTGLIQRNSISADTNEFVSFLNYARSEAVKRSSDVRLVRRGTGQQWGNGFRVRDVDNGNATLRDFVPSDNATIPTSTATRVTFRSDGSIAENTAPSFTFCKTSGEPGRSVSVARTGRISTTVIASCT